MFRPVTRKKVFRQCIGGRMARRLAEVKSARRHALCAWVRIPLAVVRESIFRDRPVDWQPAVVAGRRLFSPKFMQEP